MNIKYVIVALLSIITLGSSYAAIYKMGQGSVTKSSDEQVLSESDKITPTTEVKEETKKTANQTAAKSDKCIVTLFGKQYDVTSLIGDHPGGDVFTGKCGTDMSAIYQKKHGTNMNKMSQYLITNDSVITTSDKQAVSNGKKENKEREKEREEENDD